MYYIAVCIGLLYQCAVHRRLDQTAQKPRPIIAARGHIQLLAVTATVLLFLTKLLLVYRTATGEEPLQWMRNLPIPPIYDAIALRFTSYRQSIALDAAFVSLMESFTLFILYRTLEDRMPQHKERLLIGGACVMMSACALAAPALSSTDPYMYSAYGELGFQSYAPQERILPCLMPNEIHCAQTKIPPNVYGPLYTTYLETLLGRAKTPAPRIELLRLSNTAWVFLFFILLRFLRFAPSLITIALLNQAIFTQYVAEAHNDIIAVDLVMLGTLFAQRFPLFTFFLVTAASLVKLPFALFGAFAFQSLSLLRRSIWAAAAIVSSVTLSILWGGRPYVESLLYYRRFYQKTLAPEHLLVASAAVTVIALGFFRKRFSIAGAYTFPALGAGSPFPWYTLWAMPYMQWNRSGIAGFIITLPITTFLMETPFQIPALWYALVVILAALAVIRILRIRIPIRKIRARQAAPGPLHRRYPEQK